MKREPHLIYVHGTNGSGKSTLARRLVTAAGGVLSNKLDNGCPVSVAIHSGFVLIGKYENACGGLDGINPYRLAIDTAGIYAKSGTNVFMEGLATPGQATCKELHDMFEGRATFYLLDVPEADCIANVLKRRARSKRAHSNKPYDPSHLYKKAKSARSWAAALQRNGLDIKVMKPDNVYRDVLAKLGVTEPTTNQLLS
jgi:hypothetical protein